MDLRDMIIRGGGKGGGTAPSVEWNDVTFIDYDGSVLYSYSLEEAQALAKLPALPERDGLICQGWNWTLEEIKTFNNPITVGAVYITDDGATRLHVRIVCPEGMKLQLVFGQTVANGVSVDWGDGSETETKSGTGNVYPSHTYAGPGDYVISLLPEDECELSFNDDLLGTSNLYIDILQEINIGKNITSIAEWCFSDHHFLASITIPNGVMSIEKGVFSDCDALKSIIIPNSITSISTRAFYNCHSLTSIAIPRSITSIGETAFQHCYSLRNITISDNVISIGKTAFQCCYSLKSITIPSGMTSIESNAIQKCYSLTSIIIPNGITSIGGYALSDCYSLTSIIVPGSLMTIGDYAFYNLTGLSCFDFSAYTSIPPLKTASTLYGIPSHCRILIPAALFDEWKKATNWAGYADKMVAV